MKNFCPSIGSAAAFITLSLLSGACSAVAPSGDGDDGAETSGGTGKKPTDSSSPFDTIDVGGVLDVDFTEVRRPF